MTVDELRNLLFKLSIQAIHGLSYGSEDVLAVQQAIKTNGILRPIVNSVQVIKLTSLDDGEINITFVLSPDYMIEQDDFVVAFNLNEIMWEFTLPRYHIDESEVVAEDTSGQIKVSSEEGIVNWLIRGTVDIKQVGLRTYDLSIEEFYSSIILAESD